MNAQPDSASEPDDPLFDEAIAFLKRLEPPLESRIKNRVTVADELKALFAAGRPRPWWRRSVSIPVPIAAALGALLASTLWLSARGGLQQSPSRENHPQTGNTSPPAATSGVQEIAELPAGDRTVVRSYSSETYLCGLGRVRFESKSFTREKRP